MIETLWLFAVGLGPVLLAAAFIYALMRRRRLSRREMVERSEAMDDLFERDEPERKAARGK